MGYYNKVILVGNLTRDPQLSYLPSGTPVCEFGLAINRRWRSKEGEQREETCFIDCRCYGKSAETFNQYMAKGQSVLVEGRLQFDTWESPEGQRRSKHRVFVQNFQFLSQRGGSASGGRSESQAQPRPEPQSQSQPREPQPPPPQAPSAEGGQDEPQPPPTGDDIPF